jgi:hypothetical protein
MTYSSDKKFENNMEKDVFLKKKFKDIGEAGQSDDLMQLK